MNALSTMLALVGLLLLLDHTAHGVLVRNSSTTDLKESGIRIGITKQGLDAIHVFLSGGPLAHAIHNVKPPDIRKTHKMPLKILVAKVTATNMKIRELVPWIPTLEVSLRSPDQLEYSAKIETVVITGNWTLRWKQGLISGFSDGDFYLGAKDVHVELVIKLLMSPEHTLQVQLSQCNAVIEKLDLKLEGSRLKWIFKAFTKLFNRWFRKEAGTAICDAIRHHKDVFNDAFSKMGDIKISELDPKAAKEIHNVNLDLSLGSAPRIESNYTTLFLQGLFFSDKNQDLSLIEPSYLPAPESSQMISIQFSEAILNTLFEAIYSDNMLSFQITPNISETAANRLSVICSPVDPCLGNVFKGIRPKARGKLVKLLVTLNDAPAIAIFDDRVSVVGQLLGELYTIEDNAHLLSFTLDIDSDLFPTFANDTAILKAQLNDMVVDVNRTSIGEIDKSELERFHTNFKQVMQQDVNEALSGAPFIIPDIVGPFHIIGAEIWMKEGSIEVGCNIDVV